MDSIEARRVKTEPGNLQALRQPEEGTANQCPTTKEPTGVPVSTSKQDSHRAAGVWARGHDAMSVHTQYVPEMA